jgi:hypothetical protein
MGLKHLEYLRLDADQIKKRVRFLLAYARLCLEDFQAMSRSDDRRTGSDQVAWNARADAASSLAEAAQLTTFYDARLAVELFDAAGRHFVELGHPYGFYLRAVANRWNPQEHFDLFATGIRNIEALYGSHPIDANREPIPRPWHAPQQQLYFLLAVAGSPVIRREFGSRLGEFARSSPNRRGVAPIGALGTAMYRLWDIATHLLVEPESPTAAIVVTDHLAAMSRTYVEHVGLAMVNEYMWFHAASPVNVGDIDILGIAALASRTLSTTMFVSQMNSRMEQLPPLARVPAELGIEIATQVKQSD